MRGSAQLSSTHGGHYLSGPSAGGGAPPHPALGFRAFEGCFHGPTRQSSLQADSLWEATQTQPLEASVSVLYLPAQGSQLSWRGSPSVGWGSGQCQPGPGKTRCGGGGRVVPAPWPALGSTGAAIACWKSRDVAFSSPKPAGPPEPEGPLAKALLSSASALVPGDSLRRGNPWAQGPRPSSSSFQTPISQYPCHRPGSSYEVFRRRLDELSPLELACGWLPWVE